VRYAVVYKFAYVGLVFANLCLPMFGLVGSHWRQTEFRTVMLIGLVSLALNLASWVAYRNGSYLGYAVERLLSVGRMGMCVAAASMIAIPLLFFSPLLSLFWMPAVSIAQTSAMAFEAVCALSLVLEILYFRSIHEPVSS
jgi:hypothetical protein